MGRYEGQKNECKKKGEGVGLGGENKGRTRKEAGGRT
jgi:hypothetical protein